MTRYDNDTDQAIIHIQTIQNVLGQDVKIYLLIVHIQLSDLPESRLKLWEHVSLEWTVFSFCQNILFLVCVASVADVDNDHVSCISLHPDNSFIGSDSCPRSGVLVSEVSAWAEPHI